MDDGSAPKSSSLRAQEVEAAMAEKKGWIGTKKGGRSMSITLSYHCCFCVDLHVHFGRLHERWLRCFESCCTNKNGLI